MPKKALCDNAYVFVTVGSTTEIDYFDGIDNDNDGFIDCEDSECSTKISSPIFRKRGKN